MTLMLTKSKKPADNFDKESSEKKPTASEISKNDDKSSN